MTATITRPVREVRVGVAVRPDPTAGLGLNPPDELLTPPCKQCGSADAVYLGALGTREWYRCRDCGWTYSDSQEGA